MRPIRETIPLDRGAGAVVDAGRPDRANRANRARSGCGRARHRRTPPIAIGGRPAVRSRRDGRLRRPRRGHLRRRTLRSQNRSSAWTRSSPDRCRSRAVGAGECVEIATGRAHAGRRRRRRDGRRDRARRGHEPNPDLHAGLSAAERRPPRPPTSRPVRRRCRPATS